MKDLREIAEENGLSYVTTTGKSSGYPSDLSTAIIGFKNFEEASEFAKENNLELVTLKRRDGWDLWARTGTATHEYELSADDFGCDCVQIGPCTAEEFFDLACRSELFDLPEAYNTLQDIADFLKKKEEILNEVEVLEEGEFVVIKSGNYYKTIKQHVMSYYIENEGWHGEIGAMNLIPESPDAQHGKVIVDGDHLMVKTEKQELYFLISDLKKSYSPIDVDDIYREIMDLSDHDIENIDEICEEIYKFINN